MSHKWAKVGKCGGALLQISVINVSTWDLPRNIQERKYMRKDDRKYSMQHDQLSENTEDKSVHMRFAWKYLEPSVE